MRNYSFEPSKASEKIIPCISRQSVLHSLSFVRSSRPFSPLPRFVISARNSRYEQKDRHSFQSDERALSRQCARIFFRATFHLRSVRFISRGLEDKCDVTVANPALYCFVSVSSVRARTRTSIPIVPHRTMRADFTPASPERRSRIFKPSPFSSFLGLSLSLSYSSLFPRKYIYASHPILAEPPEQRD